MTEPDAATAPSDQLRQLVASMPWAAQAGLTLDEASPQRVVGRLDWAPERCTIGGLLHGGALMTMGDSIGAVCAFLNLPDGASTSTVESKTNLFRGVRSGTVLGVSVPLHVGRRFIVVQTDLTDDDGRRVAQVTQTQAVLS